METTNQTAMLTRWLAGLQYNAVRRLDTPSLTPALFKSVVRDDGRPLRGVLLAPDLCMTSKRLFFRVAGTTATALSNEEVAEQYDLTSLQNRYRELQDQWKEWRARTRR